MKVSGRVRTKNVIKYGNPIAINERHVVATFIRHMDAVISATCGNLHTLDTDTEWEIPKDYMVSLIHVIKKTNLESRNIIYHSVVNQLLIKGYKIDNTKYTNGIRMFDIMLSYFEEWYNNADKDKANECVMIDWF